MNAHASTAASPVATEAPRRASASFLLAHPAHALALGLGSGLSPVAPGTAGTLWAWLSWLLLDWWLGPLALGGVLALSIPVAWWASTVAAENLHSPDPGAIVIDEIVSFWLVLWLLLPAGWLAQCAVFALFRLFDAIKPGPVGWADRLFHGSSGWRGGFGILLDDLVAAGCTLLVMALWMTWVVPLWTA